MAAQSLQLQQVNTNSRYLSEGHSQYLRALAARFPDPLKLLYLVNSGSEANDLALQIAMAARPGATNIACMDGAYHGHVSSMMHASPYKFWGPRGAGGPPGLTHVLPLPDVYRCSPSNRCIRNPAVLRAEPAMRQQHHISFILVLGTDTVYQPRGEYVRLPCRSDIAALNQRIRHEIENYALEN